jgi:hypothetical protein
VKKLDWPARRVVFEAKAPAEIINVTYQQFPRLTSSHSCARLHALIGGALLTILLPVAAAGQQPADEAKAITPIRGDLYRAQYGPDYTVFLVTPEGILLADPLETDAARWLKTELASRFPGRAVRYVILSDHRVDRAEGASVFTTADVIGQQNFNQARDAAASVSHPDVPPDYRRGHDLDRDGTITGIELYWHVAPVKKTYINHKTITLATATVELIHPGSAFERDMTILYFPEERVVFAADYLPLMSLPVSIAPSRPNELKRWLHTVTALDFDLLLSGHGDSNTHADVVAFQRYVDDLIAGVHAAVATGKTMAQTRAALPLDSYSHLSNFDSRRTANIDEIYRRSTPRTFQIHATSGASYLQPGAECVDGRIFTASCRAPGGVAAGRAAGVTWWRGRLGVEGVVSDAAPVHGFYRQEVFRASPDEYTFAHRDLIVSVLGAFNAIRSSIINVDVAGGRALVFERTAWTHVYANLHVRDAGAVTVRRHSFAVGVRAALAPRHRLAVVIPLDFTYFPRSTDDPLYVDVAGGSREDFLMLGNWNARAGVGLRWSISRSAH